MKRKIMLAVATVAAMVAGGILVAAAGTANATATTPPVCPTWVVRSITGDHTTWDASPVAGSVIVNQHEVKVAKPDAGNGGTEASTGDAGIDLTDGSITVKYELSTNPTASFAAGAVRLFYYQATNANTLTDAPTAFVAADATSGTLTISGITGHVGTVGVVYDASNSAGGSVAFSDLTVGDASVWFTKNGCDSSPTPEPTTPSPTPTSPEPTPTTPAPVPTTTTTPAPVPTPAPVTLTVTG